MTRRDFRTPSSLPEETQTRCITIPASQEWLGLVNAALLMLTEEWRYDQVDDTDLSPAATAARAMQMYVEYLGVCEMACCPMRINPFTGRLQQSPDDGLTWLDVEDGPWTESLYPEFSSMPQPRPESGDDVKKCAAAATAAYVLRNLYDQTGNTLLNVVAATDWEYAGALGAMLQGFLMMIGAAAVQPFVAIASLLGIVGVKQQYVDYPLDGDDEERLTCILLENATVQPSGAVTFDFQAVWDAIDLASPKNGLVRFLLTMIGADALNYAGAIDAGVTADCSACGEFVISWDFTITDGGFYIPAISETACQPAWTTAGWGSGQLFCNANATIVWIWRNLDEAIYNQLSVDIADSGGFATSSYVVILRNNGSQVFSVNAPGDGSVINTGGVVADEIRIQRSASPNLGTGSLKVMGVTLWGEN